jgi:poly-gamma-glutamate synthesis protein (capsule biosynthesis protein)
MYVGAITLLAVPRLFHLAGSRPIAKLPVLLSMLGMLGMALLACQKPAPVDDAAVVPASPATRSGPIAAAEALVSGSKAPEVEPGPAEPEPLPEPEAIWRLPDDYLRFDGACEPGPRVTLAFGGDLLLHHELQEQAYAVDEGAAVLWSNIADLLAEPDLTYLNLEGPMAAGLDRDFLEVEDPGRKFDRVVYTAYPRFNYHASIAKDLVTAGVDVVSTANNHALDRGNLGVDRTIAALRQAKLPFIGTREAGELTRSYTLTKIGELEIAWIACTQTTNQIPDDFDQVTRCGNGAVIEDQIRRLRATGRYHKREPKVDAVIVTPHWGKEYAHTPRESDQQLAQRWIDAGAIAVIGSHPHVVQPWAKLHAEDGREGLVFYSLGNFASHQVELSRRSSLLLYVSLVEAADGELRIAGVRYVPLHVRQQGDDFFVEAVDRVQGPADARALLVALLGAGNLALPDEPKLGDPHCDEAWRPHPIPQWAELPTPFVIPGTEVAAVEGQTVEGDTVDAVH